MRRLVRMLSNIKIKTASSVKIKMPSTKFDKTKAVTPPFPRRAGTLLRERPAARRATGPRAPAARACVRRASGTITGAGPVRPRFMSATATARVSAGSTARRAANAASGRISTSGMSARASSAKLRGVSSKDVRHGIRRVEQLDDRFGAGIDRREIRREPRYGRRDGAQRAQDTDDMVKKIVAWVFLKHPSDARPTRRPTRKIRTGSPSSIARSTSASARNLPRR